MYFSKKTDTMILNIFFFFIFKINIFFYHGNKGGSKLQLVYLPLDERPCNYAYPVRIADLVPDVQVLTPPIEWMGKKKTPGNIEKLWGFLAEKAPKCNAAVLSLDLLLYGGIVPSRLHHDTAEEVKNRLYQLKKIKKQNPQLKLYAFNLITRLPSYNSDDEEPDYYEYYGRDIFLYSCITDKIQRNIATDEEKKEYKELQEKIPAQHLTDYLDRRKVNEQVNEVAIDLVKEGIIDFLIIPLDDCNPYGFSAITQRKLASFVRKYQLWDQVYIHPGADEIGCTLMARAINEWKQQQPKIYIRYNSTPGSMTVPLLEDRPLCESIKSQIAGAGGVIVHDEGNADYILFVNTPIDPMTGSYEQEDPLNNRYERERNLREMMVALEYYINQGKPCAIADVAYINGGDTELIHFLAKKKLYHKLYGYAGWNTCANTLGTIIAHSMMAVAEQSLDTKKHQAFLLERFIEDWGYQTIWRRNITENVLPSLGLNYFSLGDKQEQIVNLLQKEFQEIMDTLFQESVKQYDLKIKKLYMPWNRMFEVGLEIY